VRDRSLVRPHVLAEGDPGDHLALVDGEMGVHLRPGRVACNVDAVGNPQLVVRLEPTLAESSADRFKAQSLERRRAADRKQDLVTLEARRVGQLDDVGSVAPGPWPNADGPYAGPDVNAVPAEGRVEGRRAAGMVLGVDPLVRRDEDGRHAIAGIDLRHLDAGRACTQYDETLRQLASGRRLPVCPVLDLVEAIDVVGDRRVRADRDEDRPGAQENAVCSSN
jgi:hypothetical protein